MDVERNRTVIVPAQQHHGDNASITISIQDTAKLNWTQPSPELYDSGRRSSKILSNSESQRKLTRRRKLFSRAGDLVLMYLLIFPLAIAFWRGVWQLMDYHCTQWGIDPWLSMGLGYLIPFFFHFFQDFLKERISVRTMNFSLFYLVTRVILLVHCFGSVNQWRGLWVWMDIELGVEWKSALSTTVIGIFISIPFKTLNNVLALPLACAVDEASSIHDCPLRFQTSGRKPVQYFIDCLFSVIIIPGFVVFSWRGLWTLADIFLFGDSELHSAVASVGIGYTICVILCLCQPMISRQAKKLSELKRIAFMDMICVFGFVGCVLAWRGVWNCFNIFVAFETKNLSEWLTIVIGALGSMLLGSLSTVVVRGIGIDGDLVEDWLISYISLAKSVEEDDDVPFPEPCLCRCLCTKQICSDEFDAVSLEDGTLIPLNASKYSNSIPAPQNDLEALRSKDRLRLSELPHIDSSSQEELGMRTKMKPTPEEKDVTDKPEGERRQKKSV